LECRGDRVIGLRR